MAITFAYIAKMENIEHLRIFLAVIRTGSFSAAGRDLKLAPSSISRQISELEKSLSAQLFTRTTRQLTLTDAGQTYQFHATRILSDIVDARQALQELNTRPGGTLSLTAPISFGRRQVAPMLSGFLKEHPEIDVEFGLSDRRVDLVQEGIDAAIRFGSLPDSTLVARRIAPMRRIVCASPAYLKEHGTPKKPEDLEDHRCLTFRLGDTGSLWRPSADTWKFKKKKGVLEVPVTGPLKTTSGDALVQCASDGLGLILIIDWLAQSQLETGSLVRVLEDHPVATARDDEAVYVVYPSARFVSTRLRAFVDYAAAYFDFDDVGFGHDGEN